MAKRIVSHPLHNSIFNKNCTCLAKTEQNSTQTPSITVSPQVISVTMSRGSVAVAESFLPNCFFYISLSKEREGEMGESEGERQLDGEGNKKGKIPKTSEFSCHALCHNVAYCIKRSDVINEWTAEEFY